MLKVSSDKIYLVTKVILWYKLLSYEICLVIKVKSEDLGRLKTVRVHLRFWLRADDKLCFFWLELSDATCPWQIFWLMQICCEKIQEHAEIINFFSKYMQLYATKYMCNHVWQKPFWNQCSVIYPQVPSESFSIFSYKNELYG